MIKLLYNTVKNKILKIKLLPCPFTQVMKSQTTGPYTRLSLNVPILSLYFSGADLKPAFRLTRASINEVLNMLPQTKAHGWSHEMEVLVTIYWLACGASYRVTADAFSIPLSSICRIVHRTVEALMTILHRVIHFPQNHQLVEVGAGFTRLAGHEGLRCAVGAIDGCHIRIVPPAAQKQSYTNRKLFPSVVLQGVCDAGGTFLDVYIGNAGSVHDARVLRRSPMYQQALYPPAGYFLLGDGGYPCLEYPVGIITPYRQPVPSKIAMSFIRPIKHRPINVHKHYQLCNCT